MYSSKFISIQIFILFISFYSVISNGCNYALPNSSQSITDEAYLSKYGNETNDIPIRKLACFSLSYSTVFNQQCCYDSGSQECTDNDDEENNKNITCPKDSTIPNNCGLAYLYEPESADICTQISLVTGYCCYVEGKEGDENWKACIRTDEVDDDHNPKDDMIKNYIINNNKTYSSISITCRGYYMKFIWKLFIIGMIFIL